MFESITLPLRDNSYECFLIEHTIRVQAVAFLPTGDCGRKIRRTGFILRVERFANQQVVEIPAALLLAAEDPGQFIPQLRILRSGCDESRRGVTTCGVGPI